MRHGLFVDRNQNPIDEIMAVYMPKGRSYTGLDQVELFCHGGRLVVRRILNQLLTSGARAAEPGEYTRLAFLAGRIDLARAEAVAELIGANTDNSLAAARDHLLGTYTDHIEQIRERLVELIAEVEASIDFPEEEIDPETREGQLTLLDRVRQDITELAASYKGGRLIREGIKVAIGGRPNAGKSSLFNLLLRQERALVTPTAGTTRDYLSEWIDLDGFAVNLIDTAGLRVGGGKIERAGQESSKKVIIAADIVLWLVDIVQRGWQKHLESDLEKLDRKKTIILGNKLDLTKSPTEFPASLKTWQTIFVSCRDNRGIARMKAELSSRINQQMPDLTSGLVVTSARHQQKLKAAARSLKTAWGKIDGDESPEIVAFDLRQAVASLEEITGRVYNEDILGKIFAKFCIGK